MARNFSLVETRIVTWGQDQLQLYELSWLEIALAWFNSELIATGEALFRWIDVWLCWEVVAKSVILGHVIQDDHPVLGLTSIHLLKIYLFNREEHLRTDLTDSSPLAWDRLAHHILRNVLDLFDPLSFQLQLYDLYLLIKVINMDIHCKPVPLLNQWLVQAVKIVILSWDEMVVWVLYLEHVLKFTWLVFYLSLVVYLYRAYVV